MLNTIMIIITVTIIIGLLSWFLIYIVHYV